MKNNQPNLALIRRYLNGELDARAMYELERRAQEDPYLMDVMMGMEMGNAQQDQQHLFELDKMIGNRVQPVITRKIIPWRSYSVAAALILGVSIAGLLFLKEPGLNVKNQAQQVVKEPVNDNKGNNPQAPETILNVPAVENSLPKSDQLNAIANKKRAAVGQTSRSDLDNAAAETPVNPSVINPSARQSRLAVKEVTDSALAELSAANSIEASAYGVANKQVITAAPAMAKTQDAAMPQVLAGRVAGVAVKSRMSAKDKGQPIVVRGIVTDADGITPLAGVAVKAVKTTIGTSTDANGKFAIEVPSAASQLQVASIGYTTKTIRINTKDSLLISLAPNMQALNEVAVTGFTPKGGKPQPLIGWKAYNNYLKKEAVVTGGETGTVTLSFTIGVDGTPANIVVIKGVTDAVNAKAAEVLRNGPKWTADGSMPGKALILKIKVHQ